jgi:hypothetical protein
MPLAGFEPTIPVSERAKIFHALNRAATVTGKYFNRHTRNYKSRRESNQLYTLTFLKVIYYSGCKCLK